MAHCFEQQDNFLDMKLSFILSWAFLSRDVYISGTHYRINPVRQLIDFRISYVGLQIMHVEMLIEECHKNYKV